jgi:small-conductance mechanosensitive channel
MPYWERFTILAVVVGLAILLARFVDSRIRRLNMNAATQTRYRVLRRGLVAGILVIALLAGLTVIPQVRSVAGAILASGALIAIIVGFASQRVLGNFVAGLMIAVTQPLRLGDRVVFEGSEGVVEEINLTYTFLRADDDSRIVIPNEKLASDTIVNATIVSRMQRAEITLQVPLSTDLENVINLLRAECSTEREAEVFVSGLDGSATITMRARAADARGAEKLEQDLRVRAQRCLRTAGIFA